MAAAAGPPDVIVDAGTLGAAETGGGPGVPSPGFRGLLALARELGRRATPCELIVVSDGWMAVSAGEPLRPEKAAMLGLCRVLPQEHAHVACRAIDVTAPAAGSRQESALLDRLVVEIATASGAEQVALRGSQRWLPAYTPLSLTGEAPAPLRQGGVYLVTGGLSGAGFGLARALARAARARLALVEAALPLETAQRVAALEAIGAEVLVLTADLADEEAARGAIRAVEVRFGALHGVLHAAGEGAPLRLLQEVEAADCATLFHTRLGIPWALDRALAGRELEICVLLSSLAAVLGGVAYAAPTAAAAGLDAFAGADRGALPWRSLGWDAWQNEETAVRLGGLSGLTMGPREGEDAFLRALTAPAAAHLLVSTGDLAARVTARRRRIESHRGVPAAGDGAAPPAGRHPRPLQAPCIAPATDLEARLAAVWQSVLGFAEIGVEDNFFELGGDSFVALQVVSRLDDELGIRLPVARLYQGLTVRALATLLENEDELLASRAAQLEERRGAMERRRAFQQQRRARSN